ncbi:LuxE/PaaK family acyltransferase [Maribacter hydrothermalis]|uniref:Acyl transferase n=1 Tax=Maribacter hydrothermalis TaxID=1836467 RepID=A0A1B7Z3G3_9FLAO|nr:acyl transferase [Maribacter hydrothermalis]APQ17002.1 acyl transferase [Maribacter hydrothermalis]OBR37263.1 acyl transferase [Maribacter hydrothermalis]
MEQNTIFDIKTEREFLSHALRIFNFQYNNNSVYQSFCNHLNVEPKKVKTLEQIPFLPIEFFKSKNVVSTNQKAEIIFTSSGTTGSETSKHYVTDLSLYEESYLNAFIHFYGPVADYCIIALLPSYLERTGSSLIYMAQDLITKSKHPNSGFFLNEYDKLYQLLIELQKSKTKILIIGVSFALLEFTEQYQLSLKNTVVMETGGMKGRRKEIVRQELHQLLTNGFGVSEIHSEYGMTELLSQAYSKGNGVFNCPAWMKILVRDTEDPLTYLNTGKSGGINVIDLANINSCSFIATQDLGKIYEDGSFEIIGRFDNSDIRGCNLMVL